MTSDDLRRALAAALTALDAFDAAMRSFRDALSTVLASVETSLAPLDPREVLTVSEIVARYKVSRRVVLDARRKGHLRGNRPGGSSLILFDRAAVEEWFAGRSAKLRVVR